MLSTFNFSISELSSRETLGLSAYAKFSSVTFHIAKLQAIDSPILPVLAGHASLLKRRQPIQRMRKQYVQQNKLDLETVAGVDFRALNIGGTPTAILIDGSGKVRDFWVGKITQDIERQVIKTVLEPKV